MESKTFTRQQLHKLVWKQPLRDVARDLGISDVALGKACRRHDIPLPGRGYWAQVASGQKLTQVPLPSSPNVGSNISFTPTPPSPPKSAAELPEKHKKNYAEEPIVLSALASPHPLVKFLRRELRKLDIDKYGLRFSGTKNSFSANVSPATEERALIILDTLLQRLKKAGAHVEEKPPEQYRIEPRRYLLLDGEELHLCIREPYRQHRKTSVELDAERRAGEMWPSKFSYSPSGRLVLSIENIPGSYESSWSDGKIQLESQLGAALKALLNLPELLKQKRQAEREEEQRRIEEQWRQYELQQQQERRRQYLNELVNEAECFRKYKDLTLYLDEVEQRAAQRGNELTDSFRDALAAARRLATELIGVERRIDKFQQHGLVPDRETGQVWFQRRK